MSTQAIAAHINIKDYFLEKDPREYARAANSYEVVLQNNTDFVISRKTPKSEKELVILISQGLYYFKDAKTGGIEDVTLGKLKSYARDLRDGLVELDQVLWFPEFSKYSIERLDKVVSSATFADMCKHNVLAGISEPSWYADYWEQNKKLFIKLHSIFPTISDSNSSKYMMSLPTIFELDKRYGYNEAMFFAEALLKSGIELYASSAKWHHDNISYKHDLTGFFQLLDEPYCLNLRRLVEYIFYDTYSQGISNVDHAFWRTYRDCLDMQIQLYGKIREKYPKSLRTEHDVLSLKANAAAMVAKCEGFAERAAEAAGLAYTGKTYCIVVPDSPQQIADEGVNLSHCVGSYVERIINGDCHILFLRRARFPDQSLVTLQFCRGRITQAEGNRRRAISEEERRFLKNWGSEKKVQIAV